MHALVENETWDLVDAPKGVKPIRCRWVKPPGFHSGTNTSAVCRLNKSLYGLKQAPRACNAKITQQLRRMGFATSKSDSSLFIHKGHSNRLVFYYMLMTWSSPVPT